MPGTSLDQGTAIEPGDKVPAATLSLSGDGPARLSGYKGRWLVLYFYPKDATPGCTVEGQDFQALLPRFEALDCDVLGVSRDTLASHEKFRSKLDLGFPLGSDPDETLCRAFDVIREKNMYGRKVMGVERSTFLVDPRGHVAAAWRKVRVPGHAQAVLDALEANQAR